MTTTRTEDELVAGVMEDLGLLEATETAAPADAAMIKRRYRNLLAELEDDRVVYWPTNEIPPEAFEAVVSVMRLVVGPSFGVPGLVAADLDDAIQNAIRRIRRRMTKPSSRLPVQVDDF